MRAFFAPAFFSWGVRPRLFRSVVRRESGASFSDVQTLGGGGLLAESTKSTKKFARGKSGSSASTASSSAS